MGDRFFYFCQGWCQVSAMDESGCTEKVVLFGFGDFFGEVVLLCDVLCTVIVIAWGLVEVLFFDC